ncbi:MAG: hypothetical protein Kow00107_06750 [Planctomycetota bacterium]
MKPGAVFVNVGRGPVVDEQALYKALVSGHLGYCAIDTWWHYPQGVDQQSNTPPSSLPFDKLANVLLSPHRATHVDVRETERYADVARLCRLYLEGKPENVVSLDRGY